MNLVPVGNLNLWQFDLLNRHGIANFVSDRYSDGLGNEFITSFSSTPDQERVRLNRSKLAQALGVNADKLFFPTQVHSDRIVAITLATQPEELTGTDAIISDVKGVGLAVQSADCVPVLVYDPRNKAIGAIHAGWRGTVQSIVTKTLLKMTALYGTKGSELIACIGPSICQQNYEVGTEVIGAIINLEGEEPAYLERTSPGKAQLDLWEANRLQLLKAGVLAENIEVAGLCSYHFQEHFFSARRGDTGRFAAGLAIVD